MIRKQDDIVGSLFQDIAHLIRQRIDAELRPHELTRLTWLAIGVVQGHPGQTQTELAQRLELKNAATGKLVDRLVGRGLVIRKPDPGDRRVHRLFVTEKSDRLLDELTPVSDAIREDVLQDVGLAERADLERTLKKIKTRLTAGTTAIIAVCQSETMVPWLETIASI